MKKLNSSIVISLEKLDAGKLAGTIMSDNAARVRIDDYLMSRDGIVRDGFSLEMLSDVCGVHRRTWHKWQSGERSFPLSARRLLIAVAFGGLLAGCFGAHVDAPSLCATDQDCPSETACIGDRYHPNACLPLCSVLDASTCDAHESTECTHVLNRHDTNIDVCLPLD